MGHLCSHFWQRFGAGIAAVVEMQVSFGWWSPGGGDRWFGTKVSGSLDMESVSVGVTSGMHLSYSNANQHSSTLKIVRTTVTYTQERVDM
jgi:hypothetical protein